MEQITHLAFTESKKLMSIKNVKNILLYEQKVFKIWPK